MDKKKVLNHSIDELLLWLRTWRLSYDLKYQIELRV